MAMERHILGVHSLFAELLGVEILTIVARDEYCGLNITVAYALTYFWEVVSSGINELVTWKDDVDSISSVVKKT